MKKSLLILLLAAITVGASAQVNVERKDKNHDHTCVINDRAYGNNDDAYERDRNDKSYKKNKNYKKDNNDRDDQYGQDRDDNDDRKYKKEKGYGKQSKNIPTHVAKSFYNDYPNAKSVTWTNANGYRTATFVNGIFRPTATYNANGVRKY